jgi:hypothetical protein
MLYMVIFAALALGFYAQTAMSSQVASNQRRQREAQVAAETGLHFIRLQLSKVDIGPEVPDHSIFEELGMQLHGKLVATGNLGTSGTVGTTPTGVITIPEGDHNYIKLPSGEFRAILTDQGKFVRVKVIGRSPHSAFRRAVQQDYTFMKRYALASVDALMFNGEGKLDGYDSAAGPYSAATATPSALGSNGSITLTGNSIIKGDAIPGPASSVIKTASDTISGSIAPRTELLAPTPVSPGIYATSNDNAKIPAGFYNAVTGVLTVAATPTLTLPGGIYYVTKLDALANSTITMTGPVTIYVVGDVALKGKTINTYSPTVTPLNPLPGNFRLMVAKPPAALKSTVTILMTGSLYASIVAPESEVSLGGSNTIDFYGSIVAKKITTQGNTNIHADKRSAPGGNFSAKGSSYLEVLP